MCFILSAGVISVCLTFRYMFTRCNRNTQNLKHLSILPAQVFESLRPSGKNIALRSGAVKDERDVRLAGKQLLFTVFNMYGKLGPSAGVQE